MVVVLRSTVAERRFKFRTVRHTYYKTTYITQETTDLSPDDLQVSASQELTMSNMSFIFLISVNRRFGFNNRLKRPFNNRRLGINNGPALHKQPGPPYPGPNPRAPSKPLDPTVIHPSNQHPVYQTPGSMIGEGSHQEEVEVVYVEPVEKSTSTTSTTKPPTTSGHVVTTIGGGGWWWASDAGSES